MRTDKDCPSGQVCFSATYKVGGKDGYAFGGCTAACDTAKGTIKGTDIKFTCSGCNIASKWYIIAFSIMAAFVMKTL